MFPKKPQFLDAIVRQAGFLKETALLFQQITEGKEKLREGAQRLKNLEHEADQIVHAVNIELETVWLPDIDKEDPKILTEMIDDVIDYIEEAANRMVLFRITPVSAPASSFALLLLRVSAEIHKAIQLLRADLYASDEYAQCYQKIHEIENEGDAIHRKVLEEIMNDEKMDVRTVMKWERIYQILEDALDTCEDVAIALEHVRIKRS